MRQEIDEITAEMGWTKDAISHMHKVDNFMKECQRINPLGACTSHFTSPHSCPQSFYPGSFSVPRSWLMMPVAVTMSRKALKDFTFSNGVKVPAGSLISTHQWAVHQDSKFYSHPDVFDPDRYIEVDTSTKGAKGGNGDGQKEVRKTMYTTSKSYLPFGHGRHAWSVLPLLTCPLWSSAAYWHSLSLRVVPEDSLLRWNWRPWWHT